MVPPPASRPVLEDDAPPPRARRLVRWVAGLSALGLVAGGAWVARDLLRATVGESCRATATGESVQFAPDQMHNAATITQLAVRRGLPARAATIGVATAIQESKLRNITYGDRDSVGLFQQRPSQGWGTVEQIMDPVYSTNAFYDALVKVDGWQDMRITEIAQEVQRSAYPEAYADHEHEGRYIASAISGHSPGGLGCRLDDPAGPGDSGALREAVLAETGFTGSSDGPRVVVRASDDRHAWGVGAWAVAQAKARQITRVQVADRVWERGRGKDAWEWQEADETVPTNQVVITLAE